MAPNLDPAGENLENKVDIVVEGAEKDPYKVFTTQDEFDKHSAGIRYNAKEQAQKELLKTLGLDSLDEATSVLTKYKELAAAGSTDPVDKNKEANKETNEASKVAADAAARVEALEAQLKAEKVNTMLITGGIPQTAAKYIGSELLQDTTGILDDQARLKEFVEGHELVKALASTVKSTKADPTKHTPKPTMITQDQASKLATMFKD